MSTADEPAFPFNAFIPNRGLTKREYFAAQALPAVIAKCNPHECLAGETMAQMFARRSVEVADALAQALERKPE
jgi:hypothetical protein